MGPAEHGAPDRQRLDDGAAEGFGFARELQHQVAGRVRARDLVGGRSEGDRLGDAERSGFAFELGDVGLAAGLARARQPQHGRRCPLRAAPPAA
jgi:hypothetical protein